MSPAHLTPPSCSAGERSGFRPRGFAPDRRDHLEDLESSDHFWFAARRRLVAALARRFAGRANRVADLGCGGGSMLGVVGESTRVVTGVEAYLRSLETARARNPNACLVCADIERLPLADRCLDLVLALDVIEHVDDVGLLTDAARAAVPGAVLVVSAPAFRSLWSALDEAAGHRSRYRSHEIHALLCRSGWVPIFSTHYQFLLFPLVWAVRRLSWRRARTAERRPFRLVSAALGLVNLLEVVALGRLRLPWGSSVVVVARRGSS